MKYRQQQRSIATTCSSICKDGAREITYSEEQASPKVRLLSVLEKAIDISDDSLSSDSLTSRPMPTSTSVGQRLVLDNKSRKFSLAQGIQR